MGLSSASGIRAGMAYVELAVKDAAFVKGLDIASGKLKTFGTAIADAGRKVLLFGTLLATALAGAGMAYANVESQLAKLRAAANPTAAEFSQIAAAVKQISKQSGLAPEKIAASFTELVKAGMNVQTALNGGAETVAKFAKVAEMETAEAAVIAADAMNVFAKDGVTAAQAVDVLAQAADASSIDLKEVAYSFKMASAVAGAAGVSIHDLSTLVALLGQAGLKGSDGGTAIKTMLMAMMAPSDTAQKAIKKFGLSFRDAQGNMKPIRGMIAELTGKLGNLAPAARDDALKDIFGSDAIRPALILMQKGVGTWDGFRTAMASSLTVEQKFAILMDTMSGKAERLWSTMLRIGVAVTEALMPYLGPLGDLLAVASAAVEEFVTNNQEAVRTIAAWGAAIVGMGAVAFAAGSAIRVLAFGLGGLAMPLRLVGGALGFVRGIVTSAAGVLNLVLSPLLAIARLTFSGVIAGLRGIVAAVNLVAGPVAGLAADLARVGMAGARLGFSGVAAGARLVAVGVRGFGSAMVWAFGIAKAAIAVLPLMFDAVVSGCVTMQAVLTALLAAWPYVLAGVVLAGFLVLFREIASRALEGWGLLLGAASDQVMTWIGQFAGWASKGLSAIGGLIGQAASSIGSFASWIGQQFVSLWGGITAGASSLWSDMKTGFATVQADATQAFGAISDALKAGDISSATKVAVAFLKLEWQRGMNWIQEKWEGFKTFFSELASGIALIWNDVTAKIKTVWAEAIGWLSKKWASFATSTFTEKLANALAPIFAQLQGQSVDDVRATLTEDFARAREQQPGNAAAIDADTAATKGKIEEDRKTREAAIGEELAGKAAKRAEAMAQAQADVEDAQDEYLASIAEAQRVATNRRIAGLAVEDGAEAGQAGPGSKPEGVIGGAAAAKSSTVGTFSGFLAGQMGGGGPAQETANNTKIMALAMKQLVEMARHPSKYRQPAIKVT